MIGKMRAMGAMKRAGLCSKYNFLWGKVYYLSRQVADNSK